MGPQAPQPDGGMTDSSKWLAGSIPVAVALVGLGGLSTGEMGRIARIYPEWYVAALAGLVLGVVFGVLALVQGRRKFIYLGSAAFGFGLLALFVMHARATGEQDRPTISTALSRTADGFVAKVSVNVAGLKPEQYAFVAAQGQNSQRHLDQQSAEFLPGSAPVPENEYSKQRIYSGRIGASPDGTIETTFETAIASGLYEQIVVQVGILERGKKGTGREEEMMGGGIGARKFVCDSRTADIACLTILLPTPPPAPKASPPPNPTG